VEGDCHGLIGGAVLAFVWRDWGKKQKTSVRTANPTHAKCTSGRKWQMTVVR